MLIPYMSQEEVSLIKKYLLMKRSSMLEWGSGGSTCYFSQFTDIYYSIEHDHQWYKRIVQESPSNTRIFFAPSSDGSPQPPPGPGDISKMQEYIHYPRHFNKFFTYVLIDGRCRVDCALSALKFIDRDSFVFLHDSKRKRYEQIKNYYNVIEHLDSEAGLTIFQKK